MGELYEADVEQSNGKTVTFLVRYSKPSDPIYQEGTLVYVDRIQYGKVFSDVDRLESHISGIPCIGIEFNALNRDIFGALRPTSINMIPDGIKWIGDHVFADREGNIKLPNSIEYLGDYCFQYSCMESFLLPSQIRHLGKNCFQNTRELKEIVIPGSLTEIPEWCFGGCDEIKKIFINEGVRSIGALSLLNGGAFQVPDPRVIILPRSISYIHDYALAGESFKGIIFAYQGSYAYFWAKEHNYHVETL